MGTPGLLALAPPATVNDPEKLGRVRLDPAQMAGGAVYLPSKPVVMVNTVMGTVRLLWTLKTAQRVMPGYKRAGVPEQAGDG